MKRKIDIRSVAGLVLLCFCMRAPMSVVGPLVPQIKQSLQLSSAFSGLLTTIPLLIFALVAPFAGGLPARMRLWKLFVLCVAAILCGILLRSYCGIAGLIAGTALLGLGIGILNVLIPVWIRQGFSEQVGLVMGIYSTAMTALSAVAAGICVSLSASLFGWQNAMAVFALFPLVALPFWLFCMRQSGGVSASAPVKLSVVASRFSNWCVALFMGLQSALFFVLIAWLPSMLTERGFDASSSGMMILVFQLVSLITNFLMPIWFQRSPSRRPLYAACCAAVYALGFALLLLPNATAAVLVAGVVLLGLASGLSLSFALTVIAMKGSSNEAAAGLSSFAQCVGYLIAAPAPFMIGGIFDAAGSFSLPILLLLILCVPMLIFGIYSVRERK